MASIAKTYEVATTGTPALLMQPGSDLLSGGGLNAWVVIKNIGAHAAKIGMGGTDIKYTLDAGEKLEFNASPFDVWVKSATGGNDTTVTALAIMRPSPQVSAINASLVY